jgi:hypothetical protein
MEESTCKIKLKLDENNAYNHTFCRNRLIGNWGIVDVQDAIDAARILSAPDALLDPSRIVIRGASAGGYTTLAAFSLPLSQGDRTVFAAGAASYGISDLTEFSAYTHKFESHYTTKLIGGSLGDVPELCRQRSPIENVNKIERPLLVSSQHLLFDVSCDSFHRSCMGMETGWCRISSQSVWCKPSRSREGRHSIMYFPERDMAGTGARQ